MNDADDLLASLPDHPGWPVLVQLAADRQEHRVESVAKNLLSGSDPDMREIDKERGERAGVAWLLRQPTDARKRIERDRVS